MKHHYFLGGMITMLLFSIFIVIGKADTTISKEKAEQIALIQAEKDGYTDVKLWTRFNTQTKTRYTFSTTKNKDILVWQVNIDAAHNPRIKNTYAASYLIDKQDGSIDSVLKALTQAGMDLEVNATELLGNAYHFNLKNNGKTDYTIEWIEPSINPNYQSSITTPIVKIEFKNTLPVHSALSLSGRLLDESAQVEAKHHMILGFMIKVEEEPEPFLIFDNHYLNMADL